MAKKATIVAGILVVLILLYAGIGCTDKQSGVILMDTTGDGQFDSRGLDADGDGNVDLDADGKQLVMTGLGPYKYSGPVDSVAPLLLQGSGAVTGLSILGIIGLWWKGAKPAKMLANLITAIQMGRQELKDKGPETALAIFDKVLKNTQDPELRAWVIKAKEAMDLVSVTGADDEG